MKQNLLSATRLAISCIILLAGIYPLFIWLAVKASVNNKDDKMITVNNKIIDNQPKGKNFSDEKDLGDKPSEGKIEYIKY